MKTHQVAGGGGVQLHVVEAGNPGGRPILFIHGVRSHGLRGVDNWTPSWRVTIVSSQWICAVMALG